MTGPGPDGPALDVAGLRITLPARTGPVEAVRGVDLRIGRGETVALVGESGSGKSLTALSLLGLLPRGARMRADRLRVLGTDVLAAGAAGLRGDQVAAVFQDPMTSLNPTLTVGTQMTEGLLHHRPGTRRRDALDRAAALLDTCGVGEPRRRLRQYPHHLSGGLRQRVAIATALMTDPALLVADEPTTALDATVQAQVLSLLARLRRDFSLAVLLISHDLTAVGRVADRVCVMYAGEVVERAPAPALFARPMHPYTRALVASRPSPSQPPRSPVGFVPGQAPGLTGPRPGCLFRTRCGLARADCAGDIPAQETADGGRYLCVIAPAAMPAIPATPRAVADDPAGAGRDTVLAVDGVSVTFPPSSGHGAFTAVRDASLRLTRGGILGVIGESGSGKSTLSRVMLGLQRPTAGGVTLLGRPLAGFDRLALARAVQPVFQDPATSLNPRREVAAAIRLPLDVHRIGTRRERDAAVREAMDRCGLPVRLGHALPGQLSGGQRQRVALASALVLRPAVVVCDEPTSALDVSVQAQVLNLLLELRSAFGLSYVLVSHDLDVVRHMVEEVAVMQNGVIVEQGPAETVFGAPCHPYTRRLLAAAAPAEPGG